MKKKTRLKEILFRKQTPPPPPKFNNNLVIAPIIPPKTELKTIVKDWRLTGEFDKLVNEAIKNGWDLERIELPRGEAGLLIAVLRRRL